MLYLVFANHGAVDYGQTSVSHIYPKNIDPDVSVIGSDAALQSYVSSSLSVARSDFGVNLLGHPFLS